MRQRRRDGETGIEKAGRKNKSTKKSVRQQKQTETKNIVTKVKCK